MSEKNILFLKPILVKNMAILLFSAFFLLLFTKINTENSFDEMNRPDFESTTPSINQIYSVEFEVYGRVQGVFFRKYTQKQGQTLGLKGWCMNTEKGSVVGALEGPADKINEMKNWLQTTGSPLSKIDRCDFKNEKKILAYTFKDFKIRR